eukprot:TRINITY_DN30630_c0_g1_i1.p2 TRINITY_DN30630_c0_g1~~TRINITY_DN30630_c0_g1_i1.p2  ORF type:complete len:139 (+),score=48.49 TRINITY_DN30630_c0_g1_i1:63-419(+)
MAMLPYPAYIRPGTAPQPQGLVTRYLDCNVERPDYFQPRAGVVEAKLQSEYHSALYGLDVHHYNASRSWNSKWTDEVRELSRVCCAQIESERAVGPDPHIRGYIPASVQHSYNLAQIA